MASEKDLDSGNVDFSVWLIKASAVAFAGIDLDCAIDSLFCFSSAGIWNPGDLLLSWRGFFQIKSGRPNLLKHFLQRSLQTLTVVATKTAQNARFRINVGTKVTHHCIMTGAEFDLMGTIYSGRVTIGQQT